MQYMLARLTMTKEEYRQFLKGEWWKAFRRPIMAKKPLCLACGRNAVNLHHWRYPHPITETTIDDVIPLCRVCHDLYHRELRPQFETRAEAAEYLSALAVKRGKWLKRKAQVHEWDGEALPTTRRNRHKVAKSKIRRGRQWKKRYGTQRGEKPNRPSHWGNMIA